MTSHDELLTRVILGAIFGGVLALYGWHFWSKTRAFCRAVIRLRDRIDRSRRLQPDRPAWLHFAPPTPIPSPRGGG